MGKQCEVIKYRFRDAQAPPLVASRAGEWCRKTVETAGTPTVKTGSGGAMELTLDATNEVQSATLYQGDILPYDIDDLIRVVIWAKITASLNAAVSAVFGVASAQNATLDSVAEHAWFRLQGSNSLLAESDDGTNDNDDKAVGYSLSTTYRQFVIDFATGVKTLAPPSASKGGKAALGFYCSDDFGSLRQVAKSTNFDVSNYSGNLQLFAQIQKTAVAAGAVLSILGFDVELKTPNG